MFQNKKVNLVVSIIVAIVVWAYVVVEINPTETRTVKNIPVELKNIDSLHDRDLTVTEDKEYHVDVKVKGARSEISTLTVQDFEATADVLGFSEGTNEISVIVTIPDKVTKEDVTPATITVEIEEYVTESKPIKVDYEGTFADDTQPGFVSVAPEEIEVSGAKSLVNSISYVSAPVKSSSIKDDETTIAVTPTPINKGGGEVKGLHISQEKIDVTATLCYIKTVPVEVEVKGKVAPEYEVTSTTIPDKATIIGVKSEIDNISKLVAKDVNIRKITKTTEIKLKFNLPGKVVLADDSKNLVVIIEIDNVEPEIPDDNSEEDTGESTNEGIGVE